MWYFFFPICFCELYIDHGSGSQYFGVYTIVEEVDDTVLKTQFYSETGTKIWIG